MLKTILIGCGAISEQLHLPVLAGHPEIDLVALVDPNLERAHYFAKGYKVPRVYSDISEADLSDIDAAVIATPPFHHAPCAIELLHKGIHLLVEKPLALSVDEAKKVISLAQEKNLKVAVPLYRRFFPSFRLMVSLIKNKVFGIPLNFSVKAGGFYNWPAASLGNMKKELAGGGVLMDLGPHFLDFLFQIFEEPVELLEYQDDALGGIEADCILKLRFNFEGKSVEGIGEFARTRKLNGGIKIECERAILEFKPSERYRLIIFPKETGIEDFWDNSKKPFIYQGLWKNDLNEDESWYATFARVYDDWLAAIKEDKEPLASAQSSLPVLALIEKCYHNKKTLPKSWLTPSENKFLKRKKLPKKTKVLVTGATGFIGCRAAEILRLREGFEVRAVVRNPGKAARLARLDVEMVQFDLEQDKGFDELVEGCDAVIHCAVGTAYGDPKKIFNVTVEGTRKLARAAFKKGVKHFIHVSSMAVYGSKISGLIDESFPLKPDSESVYGKSKAKAEHVVQYYAKKGLPAVIFRPARVFGPFGFTFVTNPLQAMTERRFAWKGDPDTPCDMIYVDNVVEAFICAIHAEPEDIAGEVFNLGEQDSMTWKEFYRAFIEGLNIPLDIEEVPVFSKTETKKDSKLKEYIGNFKELFTSPEFKAFMRKTIYTDPIGMLPRKILELPKVEEKVKKLFGGGSLPVFQPKNSVSNLVVLGGGMNAVLDISKLKYKLSFELACSKEEAIVKTIDWVKFSGIV
ncbi:NAD-dependent epimerase/dehydratase [Thermodesulfatator indicus DSM 15286]|uniref:NAD-dependent epimerase/dehydratase n=1 Tax=Thermodesulfatator indicus (strain DSM 15286 / JCM 11887 / CIR29812) TaxID=667014 RepID=F8ABL2_THEID|nr:NAD-dependent epimerase/dehydratase family protein [Thermodesulfatator indicus]AEH45611.1 NAD-dependent epimerase/dehydratase [Thermodesulfatator indicus DSM 15286]